MLVEGVLAETSRPWGGTTVGDATVAPYDADTEWAAILRSLAAAGAITTDLSGVFRDELNELAVTSGAGQVSVNTGRALVHGTWYENGASVNVAVATPGASTRIDRVVLRKDWVAQTVRITLIAGVEGGAAPALVQSIGSEWDMPLYQVSITTGGDITLTDERDYIPWHGDQSAEGGTRHSFSQINGFTESLRGVWVRVKAATEARTAQESAIDDELQIPVEANQEYYFEAVLFVTEGTAGLDIEIGVSGPSPVNDEVLALVMGWATDGTTYQEVQLNSINLVGATNFDSTTKAVRIMGSYRTGNAGGTFGIQWAPATNSGSPVNVLEGSTLHVVRK